ncbi:Terpene synthase [Macleaya cordata]|uniref:Terpene synthase n=1 Tax=Macleaya cordata TaxID=56857 RepID=A0A200PXU3_MACCD|nr:Terpene synthase [Macleaya cordata]
MYSWRKQELKEEVKQLLDNQAVFSLARLELIDDLERLGLGYLFEKEISMALDFMASKMDVDDNDRISNIQMNDDLHATALSFRLLRQHGYEVSQDVFKRFMHQEGNFMESDHKDVKGMLSLFEASNLAVKGESILEQARTFTSRYLKVDCIKGISSMKPDLLLAELVDRSLELPLHLRAPRLEARWYIDQYQKREDANDHMLLQLAKLDFNLVQSIHQEELIETWKWWNNLGLSNKLRFSRDRLVECFFFAMGLFSEPHFRCRTKMTKVNCLIITIDDVYDIYGTLDELELFTDAVQRWDIDGISQLPYYMKLCFLALYNTINEIAYETLKEKSFDSLPCLRKAWADQCKSFLVEAKWYNSRYIPTLEEYMNNALVSAGGPLILLHAYLLIERQEITTDALEYFLESKSSLIRWSSLILRLTDDLATSTAEIQRGDVPKSIQCYMNETGASEEVAREYIKHLINETWKKMNEEQHRDSKFTRSFNLIAVNLARMSECVFQYGDGLGVQDRATKAQVLSLLVEPIV